MLILRPFIGTMELPVEVLAGIPVWAIVLMGLKSSVAIVGVI
jgi:hypothetical protein